MGEEGKSVEIEKMFPAWCESMKGRKGEERRRRRGTLKRGVR